MAGLLAATAAKAPAAMAAPAATTAAERPRVVALDWALASTLVAMGHPPVGAGEPDLYRRWVAEPALPAGVADVGLRVQPSLERTAALRPDLILIGPLSWPARPSLEPIAPVLLYNAFTAERRPLDETRALTLDLGRRIGAEGDAAALIARTDAAFASARARLAPQAGRALLLVGLLDERHLNVYGRGSLFGDALAPLGLVNGWTGATTAWGTSAAGVEELGSHPDADLLVLEPVPPTARGVFSRPGLWRSLAGLRRGRVATLPAAWAFGDLVAAARFAGLLADLYDPRG